MHAIRPKKLTQNDAPPSTLRSSARFAYTAAVFTLSGVRKTYDSTAVLDGVDLVIALGQTTVLIGPSGCGKSTLLGILTGLITPDAGQVLFEGKPIATNAWPTLRQRIGYVIQDGGLFPHLSGRANVTLMARHLKLPTEQINRRVQELADLTRLPIETLSRLPAEMSGGQRQRVALMRALMLNADVLLLDEPLAALDPMVRADLQRDLADAFRTLGKTIVLVTHDMGEAAFFGQHVVLLRNGKIVQQGPPSDLLDHPAEPFVEQFIGAQRATAELIHRPGAVA